MNTKRKTEEISAMASLVREDDNRRQRRMIKAWLCSSRIETGVVLQSLDRDSHRQRRAWFYGWTETIVIMQSPVVQRVGMIERKEARRWKGQRAVARIKGFRVIFCFFVSFSFFSSILGAKFWTLTLLGLCKSLLVLPNISNATVLYRCCDCSKLQ